MKYYCTNCRYTWASPHTEESGIYDESYSYCPLCVTDTYLEIVNDDRDAFTMDYFSHTIRNTRTGEIILVVRKTPPPPPVPHKAVQVGKHFFTVEQVQQLEYNYQQSIQNRYE